MIPNPSPPRVSITVRATRDFVVGPWHDIVISKGQLRKVCPDSRGPFATQTDAGAFFGDCFLGDGWERVEDKAD